MNLPCRRLLAALAIEAAVAALALTVPLGGTVLADEPAHCSAEQSDGTMSEATYRVVELAIQDLNNDRYAEAERRLKNVTERARGYERAVIFQTLGFVYAQQDQLTAALAAFEEALSLGTLPRQAHEDLMYNTGQLYVADDQYDKGIDTLERYLTTACKAPPATAHLMLANAYAQEARYAPALEQVEIALAKAERPQEPWLQLKLALHYELKQYAQSAETLMQLIAFASDNAEYWKQLSGVLLEMERSEQSLAVLALAERQGFLASESDLKSLANVYLLLEIPYKAGRLLEQALEDGAAERKAENYEYLADAWISAREWDRAETALRRAAELSSDGDLWRRLGQVLMEKEDWAGAQAALEQALGAGVDDDAGQTHYLLGVAAYNAGDRRAAERALQAAMRDPATRDQAQQWLEHMRFEAERTAAVSRTD